jgi:hypothetical protein
MSRFHFCNSCSAWHLYYTYVVGRDSFKDMVYRSKDPLTDKCQLYTFQQWICPPTDK